MGLFLYIVMELLFCRNFLCFRRYNFLFYRSYLLVRVVSLAIIFDVFSKVYNNFSKWLNFFEDFFA